jgi:hypothetical protein
MADRKEIPLELAIELVKQAYRRVAHFEGEWRAMEANPAAGSLDRAVARTRMESTELEFSWQWRNVRRIFEEKGL